MFPIKLRNDVCVYSVTDELKIIKKKPIFYYYYYLKARAGERLVMSQSKGFLLFVYVYNPITSAKEIV